MPRPHADMPRVLYEDNHLLALDKPAALPTMGTPAGRPTLLSWAKDYIREKYDKPGNVYLGVVSRLDAPTTGVVLLARTSKAARRLTEQFRDGGVEKAYWAIVEGRVDPPEGECRDFLGEDERHRRMRIVGPGIPGGKEARLTYRRLRSIGPNDLTEITLLTGRKHQIRVQMARRGTPVLGDRKYGGPVLGDRKSGGPVLGDRKSGGPVLGDRKSGGMVQFPRGIALHARRLVVRHPVGGRAVELIAPLPDYWPQAARDFSR